MFKYNNENKSPTKRQPNSTKKRPACRERNEQDEFGSTAKVSKSMFENILNLHDIDWDDDVETAIEKSLSTSDESEIELFKDQHFDPNNELNLSCAWDFSEIEIDDLKENKPNLLNGWLQISLFVSLSLLIFSLNHTVRIPGFYGLPNTVKDLLQAERSIGQLYDWQDNLMKKLIDCDQNLVYCVPTSGGKTLVAELMILREMMLNKKNALFVFPYVSIVQEKIRSLMPFSLELNFILEEYANDKGQIPVKKRLNKNCLYIATIEKAHLLLTCLYEEKRLDEIGLVVVDELHMLGDGTTRGCTLESFLLLCMLAKQHHHFDARLIAMSATLNNFEQIRKFLNAVIEENNFRPVELVEHVKLDSRILKYVGDKEENSFEFQRHLPKTKISSDPDNLCELVKECMPESPLLIFSPTKLNCENIVKLLSTHLPRRLKDYKTKERESILNDLQAISSTSICQVLQLGIPFGIAYHHSGLTTDEREIIESSFLNGSLCCIVCTSTLAAGVNLPAQRVIIRAPYVAKEFLTSSQYKQMVGRAGRAGFSDKPGESILMIKDAERERIRSLFVNVQNECISSIYKNKEAGISRIFLSLFHLRLVKNFKQIRDVFLNQTLYGIQFGNEDQTQFMEMLDQHMAKFHELGLIEKPENDQVEIKLTKLGRGAIKGLIDVNKCNRLYNDLTRLSTRISVNSIFHLLFVCTFIFDSDEMPARPDGTYILNEFFKLKDEDKHAAKLMGMNEAEVQKYVTFQDVCDEKFREKVKRFFFTLIIYESYRGDITLADLSDK